MSIYGNTATANKTSIYGPLTAPQPAALQPKTSIYDRLANPTGLGLVAAPVVSAFKGATEGFQNTPTEPKTGDFLGETVKAISNAIKQGSDNLDQHLSTVNQNGLLSLKGATAGAQTVLDDVSAVFGVAMAPLQGIASLPGVGGVVDGLNKIFGAIGEGGGQAATQILHELPIPQGTKDILNPLVHDTASLVAQIYAGKAGGDSFNVLGDKVKAITNTVDSQIKGAKAAVDTGPVKTIPVEGASVEQKIPIQSQYTPPDQLPTIQMGPKAPETLPTIQTDASPIADTVKAPTAITNAEPAPVEPATVSPAKGQVTKVASDINATLVKQGFDALSPDEQSKFTPKSYADSLTKTTSLLDENLPSVKEMATSGKGIPNDIHPQILFNAVEALATKEGDGVLLADLAKSPLGKKLSESASTLGSHGFNDNPNSAVEGIRQVNGARQAFTKNIPEQTAKVTEQLSKETRAARSPKNVWADFAKQVVCNI